MRKGIDHFVAAALTKFALLLIIAARSYGQGTIVFTNIFPWPQPDTNGVGIFVPPTSTNVWSAPTSPSLSPTNDNFADAVLLVGSRVETTATHLRFATAETNEPPHGNSVWYRWTAPASADVVITTKVMPVGVYEGSALTNLTNIATTVSQSVEVIPKSDYFSMYYPLTGAAPTARTVYETRFVAEENHTYQIAGLQVPAANYFPDLPLAFEQPTLRAVSTQPLVANENETIHVEIEPINSADVIAQVEGFAGTNSLGVKTTGPFAFDLTSPTQNEFLFTATATSTTGKTMQMWKTVTFRPSNDQFANATPIEGVVINRTFPYSTRFASKEPSEPAHLPAFPTVPSVWWKWTPAEPAVTRINPGGSDVFLYRGDSLTNLQLVVHAGRGSVGGLPLDITTEATGEASTNLYQFYVSAWSFSSGPLGGYPPALTVFTNEPGVTYWIAAAGEDVVAANSWSLVRQAQWANIEHAPLGNQSIVTLDFNGASIRPTNLQVTIADPSTYAIVLQTNISNPAERALSWTGAAVGAYPVRVDARYDTGETWSQSLVALVTSANDDFATAAEIPASFTTGLIPFDLNWATTEPSEPLFGTNAPNRTLWWRWTPDHPASLRVHGSAPTSAYGGLSVDVFTGDSFSNLALVADNHSLSRIPELKAFVPLNVEAGKTYYIRASASPAASWSVVPLSNLALAIESSDTPLPGIVMLTTALGHSQTDGTIDWQPFAKVLGAGATPVGGFPYFGQFYVGKTLDTLRPFSYPATVHDGIFQNAPILRGTVTQGFAAPAGLFSGDEVFVQLRAWTSASSYESARMNNQPFGRSKIVKVTLASEFQSPAVPRDIGDVILGQSTVPFTAPVLAIESGGEATVQISGPPGIYAIDASDLTAPWTNLVVITNFTGVISITDPRTPLPPLTVYQSRLLD